MACKWLAMISARTLDGPGKATISFAMADASLAPDADVAMISGKRA
jgi:hypothetical protein